MIRLDSKTFNLPVLFLCHFFDNLPQAVMNWTNSSLASPFGTKDNVVQDVIDRVLLMDICLVHVV